MPTDTDVKVRVLKCTDCQSLEELPDYDGPPEYDQALIYALSRHRFPNDEEHRGRLFVVPARAWGLPNLRRSIIEQIKGGSPGLAAFDKHYYDVQDTLRADALACFAAHRRPADDCPDYRSAAKLLVPDTRAERKDLGLPKPGPGASPVSYLCSFCPVDSMMAAKRRGSR